MSIRIWTDGSGNWKTRTGGYGFVIVNGSVRKFCGGQYYNTTSQRMELLAVIKSLNKCESGERIDVYSDSQHVVDSIQKGWVFRWKKQNFSGGRKNVDLWEQFLSEYTRLQGRIKMHWIRGHNGEHYNEVCDILARRGHERKTKIKDL